MYGKRYVVYYGGKEVNSGLSQVKRINVQEQVYIQLRDNIYNQRWLSGDKIPSENELSSVFGASRVTIRGAIQKLIAQGFLESRQGEGTYVCKLTINDALNTLISLISLSKRNILQVIEYRKMIEMGIVDLLIENCTPDDIDYLEKNVYEMESFKDDLKKAADLDLQFHLHLSKMSKNDLVIRINTIIVDIYQSVMREVKVKVGADAGVFFHKAILESLKQKDKEPLRKNIEEHLNWTIQKIKDLEQ